MGRRLTALIQHRAKITDPRVVPYSLRHTFKDAMRLTGAPEEVVERLMGHRSPERRTARGYGNADQIEVLSEWLAKADPFDRRRVVTAFHEDGVGSVIDISPSAIAA